MYISVNCVVVVVCMVIMLAVILFYEHQMHKLERRCERTEDIFIDEFREEIMLLKARYEDLNDIMGEQHADIQRCIRKCCSTYDKLAERSESDIGGLSPQLSFKSSTSSEAINAAAKDIIRVPYPGKKAARKSKDDKKKEPPKEKENANDH